MTETKDNIYLQKIHGNKVISTNLLQTNDYEKLFTIQKEPEIAKLSAPKSNV